MLRCATVGDSSLPSASLPPLFPFLLLHHTYISGRGHLSFCLSSCLNNQLPGYYHSLLYRWNRFSLTLLHSFIICNKQLFCLFFPCFWYKEFCCVHGHLNTLSWGCANGIKQRKQPCQGVGADIKMCSAILSGSAVWTHINSYWHIEM